MQLISFLESNHTANFFEEDLENLIIQSQFNPTEFYTTFQLAFNVIYKKFSNYILNHPAQQLFHIVQVFDPKFIRLDNIHRRDIHKYGVIKELANPSNALLREWSIYCELEFDIELNDNLREFWKNMNYAYRFYLQLHWIIFIFQY